MFIFSLDTFWKQNSKLSINCITNNGHQLIHVVANFKISEVPEMVTKNALIDPLFLSFSRIIYFVIQTVQDEICGTLLLLNGIHKLHHRRDVLQ